MARKYSAFIASRKTERDSAALRELQELIKKLYARRDKIGKKLSEGRIYVDSVDKPESAELEPAVQAAIADAGLFVTLASEDFTRSKRCMAELTLFMKKSGKRENIIMIPVGNRKLRAAQGVRICSVSEAAQYILFGELLPELPAEEEIVEPEAKKVEPTAQEPEPERETEAEREPEQLKAPEGSSLPLRIIYALRNFFVLWLFRADRFIKNKFLPGAKKAWKHFCEGCKRLFEKLKVFALATWEQLKKAALSLWSKIRTIANRVREKLNAAQDKLDAALEARANARREKAKPSVETQEVSEAEPETEAAPEAEAEPEADTITEPEADNQAEKEEKPKRKRSFKGLQIVAGLLFVPALLVGLIVFFSMRSELKNIEDKTAQAQLLSEERPLQTLEIIGKLEKSNDNKLYTASLDEAVASFAASTAFCSAGALLDVEETNGSFFAVSSDGEYLIALTMPDGSRSTAYVFDRFLRLVAQLRVRTNYIESAEDELALDYDAERQELYIICGRIQRVYNKNGAIKAFSAISEQRSDALMLSLWAKSLGEQLFTRENGYGPYYAINDTEVYAVAAISNSDAGYAIVDYDTAKSFALVYCELDDSLEQYRSFDLKPLADGYDYVNIAYLNNYAILISSNGDGCTMELYDADTRSESFGELVGSVEAEDGSFLQLNAKGEYAALCTGAGSSGMLRVYKLPNCELSFELQTDYLPESCDFGGGVLRTLSNDGCYRIYSLEACSLLELIGGSAAPNIVNYSRGKNALNVESGNSVSVGTVKGVSLTARQTDGGYSITVIGEDEKEIAVLPSGAGEEPYFSQETGIFGFIDYEASSPVKLWKLPSAREYCEACEY